MLAKRIIPCLDVKEGKVVKGIQFKNHHIVGEIIELAEYYSQAGADELVFYDITASSDQRSVSAKWINEVARYINIPFTVAGGIRSIQHAEMILNSGADKISINSPALEQPDFINQLTKVFGSQCIVIGVDSLKINDEYKVYQYTGDPSKTKQSGRFTIQWIKEIEDRGAGEIVLNCMNQDGMRLGFDIAQLQVVRSIVRIPLIASGGAGSKDDFLNVFSKANVDGALAASVFHSQQIVIAELKQFLLEQAIEVRL